MGQAQIELLQLQCIDIIVCRVAQLAASVAGDKNDAGDILLTACVCNGGLEVQVHALVVPMLVCLRPVVSFNGVVDLAAHIQIECVAAAEQVYRLIALGYIVERILHKKVCKYGRARRFIRGVVEGIARRGRAAGGVRGAAVKEGGRAVSRGYPYIRHGIRCVCRCGVAQIGIFLKRGGDRSEVHVQNIVAAFGERGLCCRLRAFDRKREL